MPTSGIAIFVVSVTTRTLPCALTPTPPPITMPSISATYGLRIAADLRVEEVLVVPELSRLGPVGACAVIDRDDVAARAQAALTGAGRPGRHGCVVALPVVSAGEIVSTIGMGQRIDGLGPVEGDQADAPVHIY